MHEKIVELKEKLNNLHTKLELLNFPQPMFIDLGPYTFPFLGDEDIKQIPLQLVKKVSLLERYTPSSDELIYIDNIIISLDRSQQNIDHLTHPNVTVSGPAINAFFISMFHIRNEIDNFLTFDSLKDKNILPKRLVNRLEYYESHISSFSDKTGDLDHKINTINEAYDAAEGLPTTLKSLRETNKEIQQLKDETQKNKLNTDECLTSVKNSIIELEGNIKNTALLGSNTAKEAEEFLEQMKEKAQGYIDKCEEAFRTTTSKGLAGAFEDKAKKLNNSIRYWVGGLLFALLAGAGLGFYRLNALEAYLANSDTSGMKIIIQVLFSILSIGAPLWFAWLSTKQIGQRFRLAEDYEFKASVSKAYEGYRREAVNLDAEFSQRLFGNALSRLEEPPLRFVEEASHSSPLMEVLNSVKFRELISKGDGAVDSLLDKAGLQRKNTEHKEIKNTKVVNDQSVVEPLSAVNNE
ncbi:hypothetical protein ABEI22_13985 [Erwinia billingiae]|uniref:hypothetical protein n=1 Tax=Erwinia billingiae TaxID=182337 RepID=UPI0032099B60